MADMVIAVIIATIHDSPMNLGLAMSPSNVLNFQNQKIVNGELIGFLKTIQLFYFYKSDEKTTKLLTSEIRLDWKLLAVLANCIYGVPFVTNEFRKRKL